MSDGNSLEDPIEMDETFSPQFAKEVNRLKTHIKKLVEDNETRRFFQPLTSNLGDNTALLRVTFNNMVGKMEEKEKKSLVKELIKLVHVVSEKNSRDKIFIGTNYERVVDQLFRYAHEKGTISTNLCAEGLIMTTDFRLFSRIDQSKWKFINDSIAEIDYKGIRNILRYILESQLRRLPFALTPEQVNEIRIVEDVILNIVDRDNNLMPPLITLSEVTRGTPKQAFVMPRLTDKLANLSVYFRPIADLTHVCGRTHIFPITFHPAFFPQTSYWEDFGLNVSNTYAQSLHTLPYRPDGANFLYTLYMILRQPLGKDFFQFQPPSKSKSKFHWDVLISVMICESMAETEALPENEPIPRYQWDNIVNIVIHGMTHHLLNPKNFFHVLRELICQCKYQRARDEVMWIVFQVVGLNNNVVRLDEAVQEIVDLYNELFEGNVVWTGASDHPTLFARFLAAACTWITLEKEYADKLPPASETMKQHVQFIREAAENFDGRNTAMLAVLSNVYRSDSKISKGLLQSIMDQIDIVDPSQPYFNLSYQRQATNSFAGLAPELMDALSLRSKRVIYSQVIHTLRTFTLERLPSPAVFETLERFCRSEDYEHASKDIETLALRSLHVTVAIDRSNEQQGVQAKDQCHFLFDFLTYRINNLHANSKYANMVNVLLHFTQHITNLPQNHQIYRLMEQFLIRRWCWRGFHEIIANLVSLFGTNYKDITAMRYLAHPRTFSSPVDQYQFPINPELFKLTLYSFLRAVKITGQEVITESTLFPSVFAGYGWPEKSTTFFPKWALELIKDNEITPPNYEAIVSAVRETARMHPSLTPNQFVMKYGDDMDPKTYYCMMAVLFKIAYGAVDSKPDITSEFYEVMEKKSPKDIVIMGNFLIDYIIADAKTQDCNEQTFKNIAKAASILVFHYQVLRADRFLLSLIMHPSTDEDALLCVQIANEFILTSDFQERIRWFHQNVPKKEQNPEEYIRQIVKYHDAFPEFEACELVRKYDSSSNPHMPTYYGCLIERLLPILDQYIYVALEQQGYKLSQQILQTIALFYKYHSQPIQLMYSVLFISHGKMSGPDAKSFVMTFAAQIDECHLTEAFEKYNHQKSSTDQLIMELIERMATSLEFVLVPPPYVAKDWKTAELNPGAQTLYLACIELMASPHSPETLVSAMINIIQMKPHLRPFNIMNLIACLLTALPSAYGDAFHEEFVAIFDNGDTANLKFEEIVFDNYEESLLLNLPNRARTINIIAQNFWIHCNLQMILTTFSQEFVPKLLEHAKTEKDLWYCLRLVMPILRRYWENWDHAKQLRFQKNKFGPMHILKMIFEKLGAMAEEGVEFTHDRHLCDLFYNCKYVFSGDFLRETAMCEFAKLPEQMRDRLKFYVSQEPQPEEHQKEDEKTTPEQKENMEKEGQEGHEKHPEAAQQTSQQHHQPLESTPSGSIPQQFTAPPQPSQPVPQQQMMPPTPQQQQPLQHHPHHPSQMEHMAPPTSAGPSMAQHHQMAAAAAAAAMHQQMTPQYPGFHHQSPAHHMGQYGMTPHHMAHPHMQHQMVPGQMHMNPMMHNMTPQQYAYMQYMQQQHQQQQQQQHHQPPHM